MDVAAPQRFALEQLERRLVAAALAESDAFLATLGPGAAAAPQLDRRQWKKLKTLENLTVFKARDPGAAAVANCANCANGGRSEYVAAAAAGHPSASAGAAVAVVGTVVGSVHDTLLGVVDDGVLDANPLVERESLATLASPSAADPFRRADVRREVRTAPKAMRFSSSAKTVELVVLTATGVVKRPSGDQVGYYLRHSVDALGERQERPRHPRGWVSSVALFLQGPATSARTGSARHTVDVWARSLAELPGLGEANAAQWTAATALAFASAAAPRGQQRKLAWLVDQSAMLEPSTPHSLSSAPAASLASRSSSSSGGGGSSSTGSMSAATYIAPRHRADMTLCGTCGKKFGAFHSVGTCALCRIQMCSRCRLSRPLGPPMRSSMAIEDSTIAPASPSSEDRAVVLCKRCLARANDLDALTAAVHALTTPLDCIDPTRPPSTAPSVVEDRRRTPEDSADEEDDSIGWGSFRRPSEPLGSSMDAATLDSPSDGEDVDEEIDTAAFRPTARLARPAMNTADAAAMDAAVERQRQLWMKMAELRIAAESTYQMTMSQAHAAPRP